MAANEKNESKPGEKVPPRHGKQAEILASTSDEDESRPELARDRQPKPKDAGKLKRSMKSEPKQDRGKSS